MANILSHNMQRAMGLNGYQMLRQYNYTVFSSNIPERIILEVQSIVKQLIKNPRLEYDFRAAESIALDGGYYII